MHCTSRSRAFAAVRYCHMATRPRSSRRQRRNSYDDEANRRFPRARQRGLTRAKGPGGGR
eukprot:1181110-Prorocentrum_minimum.AAC.4